MYTSPKLSRIINGISSIGNTRLPYMQTVLCGSIPELPPLAYPVRPRPPLTIPKQGKMRWP